MNAPTRFAALTLSLSLVAATAAQEWNSFRGATFGHATSAGLPTSWTATENVRWKTDVPGKGWSSPVLLAGRLYLTSAKPSEDGRGHTLHAMCLDAGSGRLVWDRKVFEVGKTGRVHNKNSYASPTPIITKDRLYVHFGHQGSACLDLSGKVIWQNRTLGYTPVHGNGGSQILVDGKLFFSIDGSKTTKVVALDADTGKVVWQTDRDSNAPRKFSFTTPLYIEVKGRKQIISPASNMVCSYAPDTGEELWRVVYDGYSVIPQPVYGNGLVYICTGYNSPQLYAIRPDGSGDVTDSHVAWIRRKKIPHTPSLLLVKDRLFMVSDKGFATCMNAKSGEQVWQERIGGNYSASPVYANGVIYFQNERGGTVVVKAQDEFQVLGKNKVGDATLASYAVGANEIYLRTEKSLLRIQN